MGADGRERPMSDPDKVSSHVEYGCKLVEDAKGRLAALEGKRDKMLHLVRFVMEP